MIHKHGGDIYSYDGIRDFSANINFRGMPEAVERAALQAVSASVHYPDPECRELKEALARRERETYRGAGGVPGFGQKNGSGGNCGQDTALEDGACSLGIGPEDVVSDPGIGPEDGLCSLDIGPENVICGNGAAELMFSLAAAIRPKQALLAVPSFFEYEQALSAFGCGIAYFEMKEEQDFLLDDRFFQSVSEKTELIVLGNPNNPTGRLIEASFLERLLELCRERGIFLVIDESFLDFLTEEDKKRTAECGGLVCRFANLFVLRSFTKMYAMPGLRFGYGLCGDRALLDRMRMLMQPWNVSRPAQEAALAAAGELEFARRTAKETKQNREEMKRWMEQAGYRVFPSDANFLLFRGPEDLKERCLERGFLIRDCSNFPGLGRGYFRICIRSRRENQELMEALAANRGKE